MSTERSKIKSKEYSLMMSVLTRRAYHITKFFMFLISKKHRPLHIFIILSIVIVCCPFDFSFAEDKPSVSESHKDSNDVSELPEDSNSVAETHKESTDIEELLEESKAVAEAIEDSNDVSTLPEDSNDIAETHEESTDVGELLEESKAVAELPEDSNDVSALPEDSNGVAETHKESQDVEELLEESKKRIPRQWFEDEVIMRMLRPYQKTKKYLYDEYRLDTAMEHVLVYQRATGGRRPREQSVYNLTLFGQWHISEDPNKDLGIIGFSFEERDNITNHGVSVFSREVGGSFQTHGFRTEERSRTALRQLWWRKKFAGEKLTLTLGKLHHASYYNRNTFAGNARTHFLSYPFSRNPNRLIPNDGLGANLNIKFNDDSYMSVGFGDVRADHKTSGFDTIEEGDLFKAAEFGLTPNISNLGRGNYRFTVWHIDKTDLVDKGYGFALSFDQELNKKLGVFARYGYTEPQVTYIKNFVSGGFVIRDPWGIQGDLFGFGISWDETSDTKEDEIALEVFHRMQATKLLQITPSILLIFNPAESDKTDPVAVFGFRARTLF